MIELTDADRHLLQSTINSQVHQMKLKRSELYVRFNIGAIPKGNFDSGRKAISQRIQDLHNLKWKLGCWEGFSQQPKKAKDVH